MSLEQIWRLNDKLLVNYFSEPSSNELTRNFAYTCALIPLTCAETFTSFGSELKARNMMKEHLLDHMRQLVTRSRGKSVIHWSMNALQSIIALCFDAECALSKAYRVNFNLTMTTIFKQETV